VQGAGGKGIVTTASKPIRNTITLAELTAMQKKRQRVRGIAPKEQRTYGGRVYHSKAEANRAAELDILKHAGKIAAWTSQVPFPIEVNGVYICTVIADFRVCPTAAKSGSWVEEIKGMETEIYKLKRKLLMACYPKLDYRVIHV
jgi:Protein of unknown function (DUF1064)